MKMAKIDIHESLRGKWEDGTRPKDLFAHHVKKEPATYLDDLVAGLIGTSAR